ncbi:MAG TPA: CHAT domain-containing protein [Bacteroidales bacterium]|nr:CHAT domain-containing protein [Bacteroidales bacterium]HRW33574.1 CHAT domain-containing protein [Thermotogota bacterium]
MENSSLKNIKKKIKGFAKLQQTDQFLEYSEQIVEQMLVDNQYNYSSKKELTLMINQTCLLFGFFDHIEALVLKILKQEMERTQPNNDFIAFIKNLLGELHYYKGNYDFAMDYYKQAYDSRRALFGGSHPDTIETSSNLALLYTELGRFTEAEKIFTEVLKIFESEIIGHIEDYIKTLWNTGLLYQYWGKYAKSIEKYLMALEISQLNGTDELTDTIENNMGVLYLETGNYEAAENHLQKSFDYSQKIFGKDHPKTITTCNNLLSAQLHLGKLEVAQQGFEELLNCNTKNMPITLLKIKINYAVLLINLGNTAKAMKILKPLQSCEMIPDIKIKILSNLSKIYLINQDDLSTFDNLEMALKIQEQLTGKRHIQYTKILGMLAHSFIVFSQPEAAYNILKEATDIQNDILLEVSTSFSRDYAWNFLQRIDGELNKLLSLFYLLQKEQKVNDSQINDMMQEIFGIILRRKAVVFETGVERYHSILKGTNPFLKDLFESLIRIKEEIVLRTTKGYFSETAEENRKKIKELNSKADTIESRIASAFRMSPESTFLLHSKTKRATLKLLQSKIPQDALFVDIFKFNFFDFYESVVYSQDKKRSTRQNQTTGYILFYIHHDKTHYYFIDNASEIEQIIKKGQFRETGHMRGEKSPSAVLQNSSAPELFHQKIWQILFQNQTQLNLSRINKLFVSPDGEFNNLPFETLICENGHYLIENYAVQYLCSGRDLINQKENVKEFNNKVYIFANPSFEINNDPNLKKEISYQNQLLIKELEEFEELPGTASEAQEISNLLFGQGLKKDDVFVFSKDSVNDGEMKKITSPSILHLATHGFYLENRVDVHPYARCGIALSGINNILRGETIPEIYEDGLLTASDILSVNLLNTEIVVLSACKTGLGQINPGEGIMGLCSALISSGVSSVMVSLWNVPDVFTVKLMSFFYNFLLTGMKKSEALKASKQKLIHQLRSQWGEAPSWIWGGFIIYGDDSPVRLITSNTNLHSTDFSEAFSENVQGENYC